MTSQAPPAYASFVQKRLFESILFDKPADFHDALAKGADIQAVDSGRDATPLGLAAHCGRAHFVERLIELGALVDAAGSDGATPAMRAARSDSPDCLRLLDAAGADFQAVDARGGNALTWACDFDAPAAAAFLLARGLDPNFQIRGGLGSPLTLSAEIASYDMVRILLSAGADPNLRAASEGRAPLHCCATASSPESAMDCAGLLMAHGADLEAIDGEGRTPLRLAKLLGAHALAASIGGRIERERERSALDEAASPAKGRARSPRV